MLKKYSLLLVVLLSISSCLSSKKTVPIHAALNFKDGSLQPVRRTDFYLIKEHERDIEAKTGKLVLSYERIYEENFKDFIIAKTTTDFEGKGVFEEIPKGTYYILGATPITDGYVNWCYKIEVSDKAETVILDFRSANQINPL